MDDICTACLCTGRKLSLIGETGTYYLYSQILNEIPVYDFSQICIKVCWECKALLMRFQHFKKKVQKSYEELRKYLDQNPSSKESITRPSHLQICRVESSSYPQIQIKTEYEVPIDGIKSEVEEHCEPETFVNDLDVGILRTRNPLKKTSKKKDKDKSKKKVKKIRKSSESVTLDDNDKLSHISDISDLATSVLELYDKEKDGEEKIKDKLPEKKEKEIEKIEENIDVKITKIGGGKRPRKKKNGMCATGESEELNEKPQCVECGKLFSSKKTYRYHLEVLHKGHNRFPCPRCGKVYQWKSNLGRHLRSHKAHDDGELYCGVCDKRFSSVATYRQHLSMARPHLAEHQYSFMCNECGDKFVSKTRLKDHIDWVHLKKIKYRCETCNKPFKSYTSMYVHLQNVHRNKERRDNLCHVCGKSYQNTAKLKCHITAMHTRETPYQCQQCSATFSWYSSLYRHVREVHYKMKLQSKKERKTKKGSEVLPSMLPPQLVLPPIHQPGPA